MNVKLVFADRVESWDTRADGTAASTHATLCVHGQDLCLYSRLRYDSFDADEDEGGFVRSTGSYVEVTTEERLLTLPDMVSPKTLPDFLALSGVTLGLLRLDVDGESIYEYSEPEADGAGDGE